MSNEQLIEDYQAWAAEVNAAPEGRYLSPTNILLFAILKELQTLPQDGQRKFRADQAANIQASKNAVKPDRGTGGGEGGWTTPPPKEQTGRKSGW